MRDEPREPGSEETGDVAPPPAFEAPHPNGAVQPPEPARKHAPWEFLILTLFVLILCIGIILGWTLVGSKSPEKLDATTAAAVAAACDRAQAKLQALPDPDPTRENGTERAARSAPRTSPSGRWSVQIAAVHPKSSTQAAGLRGWTKDWTRMIDARDTYATLAGGLGELVEPRRQGALHLSGQRTRSRRSPRTWTTTCGRAPRVSTRASPRRCSSRSSKDRGCTRR